VRGVYGGFEPNELAGFSFRAALFLVQTGANGVGGGMIGLIGTRLHRRRRKRKTKRNGKPKGKDESRHTDHDLF
jgi:hypothetical protein